MAADCTEGRQISCACPGGREGVQQCNAQGHYETCVCAPLTSTQGGSQGWPAGTAGSGNKAGTGPGQAGTGGTHPGTGGQGTGGSSAGAPGAGGSAGSTMAPPAALLHSGTSRLIDLFVSDAGIMVVLADAVIQLDRQGAELQHLAWPRQITAAAFDGERLVVTDKARFTTLDVTLQKLADGDLYESCQSAVLVSKGRLVCGPTSSWERIFVTYDSSTGAHLASSKPYTYQGLPMKRVPGQDAFVTVSNTTSPSDFFLYRVDDTGLVTYVNESPYHGDFRISDVYAFDAGAEHVVTDTGLLLKVEGPGCTPQQNSSDSGCFVKDGTLGTLWGQESFAAMDSDGQGKLHAVVSGGGIIAPWDSICENGCRIQRIDVASHLVETDRAIEADIGAVTVVRHDPVSDALVLGYRLVTNKPDPNTNYPGYRVVLQRYE